MPVIAVFNQKGGVGKTTTTLNLGAALAKRERRPLLIDLDPQASLTLAHGLRNTPADSSLYAFFSNAKPLSQLAVAPKATKTAENPPINNRALTTMAFLNFDRTVESVSCSMDSPVIYEI